MAKGNIKFEKITPFGEIYYASKAFYALFMRFHLTKSSTALFFNFRRSAKATSFVPRTKISLFSVLSKPTAKSSN